MMRYLSNLYLRSVDFLGYLGSRLSCKVFGLLKCTLVLIFLVFEDTELFTAFAAFAAFFAAGFLSVPACGSALSALDSDPFFPLGAISLKQIYLCKQLASAFLSSSGDRKSVV